MQLIENVTESHVEEAHRLFTVSTIKALSEGVKHGIEQPKELKSLI